MPSSDGSPLFKPLANNSKEHFLLPYYPMEGRLLRDVHCILIDNREHSVNALDAKSHRQYDRLPATEEFIDEAEMDQTLKDNADQLLFLRERIYDFGVRISK
jgi:hypothetical protein